VRESVRQVCYNQPVITTRGGGKRGGKELKFWHSTLYSARWPKKGVENPFQRFFGVFMGGVGKSLENFGFLRKLGLKAEAASISDKVSDGEDPIGGGGGRGDLEAGKHLVGVLHQPRESPKDDSSTIKIWTRKNRVP